MQRECKMIDKKVAKQRYNEQKYRATNRGIQFNLTFEQWYDIWDQSGKWEQRGCKKDNYVMSRIGDTGAYDVGNVFVQLHTSNARDGQLGKKLSSTHIQTIKQTMLGNKNGSFKRSPETCENMRQARLKYWENKRQEKELANG
jgi:hypothetical protein